MLLPAGRDDTGSESVEPDPAGFREQVFFLHILTASMLSKVIGPDVPLIAHNVFMFTLRVFFARGL